MNFVNKENMKNMNKQDNAEAWLKRAEEDVKALKIAYTEQQQYVTNSDGLMETWDAQMTPAEFEEKVEVQFAKFKENFLENLNKEKANND